jgi:LuxR family transcriptional regulator, maltose regulon positive regulatory protein
MKTNTGKLNPLIALRQTKLHRPRPTRHLVVRQRLWEALDKGKAHPLILICAPAGYGKTTLVSSWIESMQEGDKQRSVRMPATWLSLDNSDSDLGLFLEYLIGALRTIYEGACTKTLDLVLSTQLPSQKVIATSLINEIVQLPGSFILVLDDYQNIQGQAVHDLLDELLQYPSPLLHLVLISRTDPPLSLARLRANGMLTEIRSRDLRFIEKEATAYLNDALEITLSDSVKTQLEERLEGWIAGLRLATLSLRTAGDASAVLTTLADTDTNITDYLADEVLAHQLPAIQAFLLKTSILDRFSVSLCEAVVGESDPAWSVGTCIEWLERLELFITPLDNRKQWYRYHHLFQELLKQRLKTGSGQETEKILHQRASAWFAKEGMVDEAIQHARESGDLQLTAGLMERGLKEVLNREDRLTLDQWLHLLPEEYTNSRPSLLMIKVWILGLSWQIGTLMKVLQQVEGLIETGEAALDTDAMQTLRGQIATLHAMAEYLTNQPARALESGREGLTLLPQSWTYVRGVLMEYLGLAMQATGQSRAAERMLFDLYESHDDKTDGFAMRILAALCFNNLTNGNLEQSRQVAHIMLQQATRSRLPISKNWGHYFIGLAKYQWNELDAAEEHLTEIFMNRFNTQPLTVKHAMTVLARVHQTGGRSAEAWQILETLSQFDMERIGYEEDETRSSQARLSLLQGKMDDAFRWADSFTSPPPEQPLLWMENPHVTRAQILITRGSDVDLQEAIKILNLLYEMSDRTYNTRSKIEVLALRALALDALGRAGEAEAELQQALELAQPGGFIRVFVDLGSPMQAIITRLDKLSPYGDYIHRLLAAFTEEQLKRSNDSTRLTAAPGSARNLPGLTEPLTAREMDVLMLLREPLSTKEIASRLYLSPSTVKRHTINLYGKLGVHSRKEAVAAATTLGILPPP